MTFRTRYCQEKTRVIPAVMIDAREGTPLAAQIGTVIKTYTDAEVAKVTDSVLLYKIETMDGNLAGYFSLQVSIDGATVTKFQQVLRPAFQSFITQINQLIANFITAGNWKQDSLQ